MQAETSGSVTRAAPLVRQPSIIVEPRSMDTDMQTGYPQSRVMHTRDSRDAAWQQKTVQLPQQPPPPPPQLLLTQPPTATYYPPGNIAPSLWGQQQAQSLQTNGQQYIQQGQVLVA